MDVGPNKHRRRGLIIGGILLALLLVYAVGVHWVAGWIADDMQRSLRPPEETPLPAR